jgi:lipopolysaccharide/colanic/teichoic acid biosynthesis glycosyltransferase
VLDSKALGEIGPDSVRGDGVIASVLEQETVAGRRSADRGAYCRFMKPIADRALGALLLLIIAPLVLVVVALVRLKLGPRVLYRQRRVGKDDRVFTMYKFRTMEPDRRRQHDNYDGADRRIRHKGDEDPRHTQFGQTLRKWSLDELPQLWNVIIGDMSMVGPRPELVDVVMKYDLWSHPRNLVKPGITGLWQISPHRRELLHENLEYDVAYVSDVRFWTDVKILLKTPKAVLERRGR